MADVGDADASAVADFDEVQFAGSKVTVETSARTAGYDDCAAQVDNRLIWHAVELRNDFWDCGFHVPSSTLGTCCEGLRVSLCAAL